MRLILSLVALTSPALAALNGHCSGTATGNFKNSGICINTNTCRSFGGNDITGGCPSDPTATRCRVVGLYPNEANNPCGGISYCDWTANGCAGSWVSGYCPGGSNYKCCKEYGRIEDRAEDDH